MISLRGTSLSRMVLIRPGATCFDEQGRMKGCLDMPLSERGIEQVNALADELASLALDVIYTAPCQSARQTASRIAMGRDVKPKVIDAFRNIDQGLWHGKLIDEIRRNQPRLFRSMCEQPDSVCAPGGETLSGAWLRVERAMRKCMKKSRHLMAAFIVPDPLASVIASHLKHEPSPQWWKVATDSGGWQLIESRLE